MIIESMLISNFRQFFGSVSLDFSTDPEKNITVVHGANGSGKTTLLNAFKWCFYGETDFDTSEENILNEAAIVNADEDEFIDIKIEVRFSHEDRRYCAIRTQKFKKIKGILANKINDPTFALEITGEDGQTTRSKNPHAELKVILPPDLQPYFFFNGERIEHIAGVNQSVQVQDAIKRLMGLELVERAISHVNKAKNIYRKTVRSEVSDQEKEFHDLIEHNEELIREHNENIVLAKRQENLAELKVIDIQSKLKQYEKSRELQEKRDELELDIDNHNDDISDLRSSQKKLLNDRAFLVLSENLFDRCHSLVESNRKKGVLPYGIKEQFIDDRISLGKCICGTAVIVGSKEHNCLLEVRKSAGSNTLESTYTTVSALLKSQKSQVKDYRDAYKELSKKLKNKSSAVEKLKKEADEVSARIFNLDDKKITQLEKDLQSESANKTSAAEKKTIAEYNKTIAENQLKENKLLLDRIQEQKNQSLIANLRLAKAEQMSEVLTQLRGAIANKVREELSNKVDSTFQSIIRKPLRAVIDSDYRLQVLKVTDDGEEYVVHEQSTGERQVTSLSFISSIIALAKQKHERDSGSYFQGGLYPLVMDSPFGSLDDDYREKVAEGVSILAEQVIIFVSNSQWNGRVKKACEGKVGKSYQLIYHTPKSTKGLDTTYTRESDNGFEYSTLNEVTL